MAMLSHRKTLVVTALCICAVMVGLSSIKKSQERKVRSLKDTLAKFTFDDVFNSDFSYKHYHVDWVSGTEYLHRDTDSNIKKINAVDSSEKTIMPGTVYIANGARSYKVSADLKYVALLTEYKKGWRSSYNGTYLIYDVNAGAIKEALQTPPDTQYFVWSPVGNALAYVNGFDIYYRPSVSGDTVRVTFDGRSNYIYNGIPDWVYEEEMISSNNVMYFSTNGTYLAYAKFDDSGCEHVNFERYDGGIYPNMLDVSYPKAGTTQPTNKVLIYNTQNNITIGVNAPWELSSEDNLFNRVVWYDDEDAAVIWCNRIQTKSITRIVNTHNTHMHYLRNHEFSSSTGWLYQRRPYWIPVFANTLDVFYTVRPNNGWQHLYRVYENDTAIPVTEGEFTVTSYSASYPAVEFYHPATQKIYFFATKKSPQHKHIYRNSDTPSEPECMTCKFTSLYPGRCDHISTHFSTDGSYVVFKCGGDELPPLYLQARIDHAATNPDEVFTDHVVLQGNDELKERVENTAISTKEYGTFPSTSGYDFSYQIWKPPNFDPNKKYPLLIDVYAGPGYQRVYNIWSRGWSSRFLPSSLDIVVASVDGRGSNFYGDQFMHEVYKKLGQLEPLDQLEFAKYMGSKQYIDSSRIAVWGWSYGGYTTSLILANDVEGLIKCGLAVAPLADWKFYDTIYSERYMTKPQDNAVGYDRASVLTKAGSFPQSSYVLIHGTADDNVHFQNAARIESALVESDIDFKAIFYADQDHSINVGNARKHNYKVLTRELTRCFGMEVPDGVWTP